LIPGAPWKGLLDKGFGVFACGKTEDVVRKNGNLFIGISGAMFVELKKFWTSDFRGLRTNAVAGQQ
jgi:hypothetical protein